MIEQDGERTVATAPRTQGYAELVRLALRLAAGESGAVNGVEDWDRFATICAEERLLVPIWHRAGTDIRGVAPEAVSDRWLREYRYRYQRSMLQFAAAHEIAVALRAAGCAPVWLKGHVLSNRVWGDPYLRFSTDTDFWIPLAQLTSTARGVLDSLRGQLAQELPSGDQLWSFGSGDRRIWIEVHPQLVNWRIPHVVLPPPDSAEMVLDGMTILAHAGATLPIHLAIQLAKHRRTPLLGWLDFRGCWMQLSADEQSEARAQADLAGARNYLRRALKGVTELNKCLAGIPVTSGALEITSRGRRVVHPALRHLLLADGFRRSLAAARPWLGMTSRNPWLAMLTLPARIMRYRREILPRIDVQPVGKNQTAPPPHERPARTITTDAEELSAILDLLRSHEARVWLVARGSSMSPAIPPGASVRIAPIDPQTVMPGDVLLAVHGDRVTLHRLVRLDGAAVVLKGDNNWYRDAPIARTAILGRAEVVEVGGQLHPIPHRRVSVGTRLHHAWCVVRNLAEGGRKRRRAMRTVPTVDGSSGDSWT